MRRRGLWIVLCVAVFAVACDGPSLELGGPEDGARIAVEVAPLSLDSVTDARYSLSVHNGPGGTGQLVWERTVDASQFGDGAGSLSYVGPCDAATGANSVTVVLHDLYEGAGQLIDPGSYENPTPISRDFVCVENSDVSVVFDMTIMRDASQGFFDVAVNFDDIFCSAKLDCVRDGTAEDLELLHNPLDGGRRDLTAVLGFACTASPTGEGSFLYLSDPVITCSGLAGNITVDATALGAVEPSGDPADYLFAAAVYRGQEQLLDKSYWNVAVGLNDAAFEGAGTCTLSARGTASVTEFPVVDGAFQLPAGVVYPFIEWNVTLSDADGRVCAAHEVNGGDGVATVYEGYLGAANQFNWSARPVRMPHAYDAKTGHLKSQCGVVGMCPAGFRCGAEETCEGRSADEVAVPAGSFWMGCNSAAAGGTDADCAAYASEQPQHLVVHERGYAIDRLEVTAADYAACVDAGACTAAGTGLWATYETVGLEAHPINHVSWEQAKAYCEWGGKAAGAQRLCTESEWERAARGGCETVTGDCATGAQMRKYPWDAGDGSPSTAPTSSLANFNHYVGATVPAGDPAYAGNASPYGVRDMTGNVWEWTADWHVGYGDPPAFDDSGTFRVRRGGGFQHGADLMRASRRFYGGPTTQYWDVGVRCCRSL